MDAELLADVYIELCGGNQKNLISEAKTEKVKNDISIIELMNLINKKQLKSSRKFYLSKEELNIHKEFINSKIKNNIWYTIENNEDDKK